MTVRQLLVESSRHISSRDAETLLIHVAERDRAWLLAYPEADLTPEQTERFEGLVYRRARHEPLQYLTGQQQFYGLDLRVTPDVLIPRPETELLVEEVLAWGRDHLARQDAATGQPGGFRIVDVGTGSGAIALALASALPLAEIWAVDLSAAALSVAKANAQLLGLEERIHFELSDLLSVFPDIGSSGGGLDVVVSNPPYVPTVDAPALQPEVRDFEPHLALFAGPEGLEVYRRLIPQAWQVLRPGGLLAVEFGYGQKDALAGLLAEWQNVRFREDYAGIARIVLAERP